MFHLLSRNWIITKQNNVISYWNYCMWWTIIGNKASPMQYHLIYTWHNYTPNWLNNCQLSGEEKCSTCKTVIPRAICPDISHQLLYTFCSEGCGKRLFTAKILGWFNLAWVSMLHVIGTPIISFWIWCCSYAISQYKINWIPMQSVVKFICLLQVGTICLQYSHDDIIG